MRKLYRDAFSDQIRIMPVPALIQFVDRLNDRGVAQLGRVLSFLAEIIVSLLAEALSFAEVIVCRSALAAELVGTLSLGSIVRACQGTLSTCGTNEISAMDGLVKHMVPPTDGLVHGCGEEISAMDGLKPQIIPSIVVAMLEEKGVLPYAIGDQIYPSEELDLIFLRLSILIEAHKEIPKNFTIKLSDGMVNDTSIWRYNGNSNVKQMQVLVILTIGATLILESPLFNCGGRMRIIGYIPS
ncbi:hypothetical protein CsSME_00032185 [Camellia sinensis var. sinensis]